MNNKIRKVLIANRGEIALRIQRAAINLGIEPIIALSEADAQGYVARNAKNFVVLGAPPVAQSYTNIDKIIAAAKDSGCDAIHPGYGFLSERADFALAVQNAGLTWIGPASESIEALGSKTAARAVATANNVPVATGTAGELDDAELVAEAKRFGFPVLIKAVAGGGGRGMRKAFSAEELVEQLPRARGEAKKNFGSDDVFLEQLIIEPRHVEVQIFGDQHGSVVSFGTRDCSAQRRHQKVVEEGPAPFLSENLRQSIESAAVRVAKAVGYSNAGTAEFLVAGEKFFFLEMNTRIQVEHPVTEEVTGIDLVELQFKVASGERIETAPRRAPAGHAIELRLYAEDPANNFAPGLGTLTDVVFPKYSWLRVERGVESGDEITPYYDAMIAKLIVTGANRVEAVERAQIISRELCVAGVPANQAFLAWLLHETPFAQRPLDITYIDRNWNESASNVAQRILLVDPAHRESDVGEFQETLMAGKHRFSITHEKGRSFLLRGIERPEIVLRSNSRATGLQAIEKLLNS